MSDEAKAEWVARYPSLAADHPGLFGAAIARAEMHVVRIAVAYALMGRSTQIELKHLDAALEVWRYSRDSARYIFGTLTGDRVADDILASLRGPARAA
jgi:hypothetical protein